MKKTALTLTALVVAAACTDASTPVQPVEPLVPNEDAAPAAKAVEISPTQLARFEPAAPETFADDAHPSTAERVALGRQLFFDARFSKNHDVSCNTCHTLENYGVDGLPTSKGHKGAFGTRNSPTVYNAAGHFAQFWDGRAADVEEQATGPVMNPAEMAMPSPKRVLRTLKSMPGYVEAFEAAFPQSEEPVSLDNFATAIGAFERRLTTPAPWPSDEDKGRFEVTKKESDAMMFKVPSLRNIAKTGPYFHDGSAGELSDAVAMMGRTQLGKELSAERVASIEAFLGALTGKLPEELITAPELPESTEKTPKPDPT